MSKQRVRYYSAYTDDFFQAGEAHRLPAGYVWIRRDILSRLLSAAVYGIALAVSTVYCRLFLHLHIRGAAKVRRQKGGFFLYGNHTQPVGDVFHPALACFPKRIYTVVNAANLALPGIGGILPYLGALPLPDTLGEMRRFTAAVEQRIGEGHPVILYPEAHLWEYYTGIRPFSEAAFKYPAQTDAPVYCMTTTYQRRRLGKRPRITLYIDGPFAAAGSKKEKARCLRDAVYACMQERAGESTYAYVTYLPREEQEKTERQ